MGTKEIDGKSYECYGPTSYFVSPLWRKTIFVHELNKEKLAELREEAAVVDRLNEELYRDRMARLGSVVHAIKELFGNQSNAAKYVSKLSISQPQSYTKQALNYRDAWEKSCEEVVTKKSLEEDAEAKLDLLAQAIEYLVAAGKSLRVDFTPTNAVDKADELAFGLEIQRIRIKHKDQFIPFEGGAEDCKVGCRGWDMKDEYCECGTAHVFFIQAFDHSFLSPHVYAGSA